MSSHIPKTIFESYDRDTIDVFLFCITDPTNELTIHLRNRFFVGDVITCKGLWNTFRMWCDTHEQGFHTSTSEFFHFNVNLKYDAQRIHGRFSYIIPLKYDEDISDDNSSAQSGSV